MLVFVSRDKRTHELFRSTWMMAAKELGEVVLIQHRKQKHIGFFILSILKARFLGHLIFCFGVSEALFLAFVLPNVIVITGLGRLLMPGQKYRKFFFGYLRFFYKKRKVVVLNQADLRIFRALKFYDCTLINGEGVDIEHLGTRPALENHSFKKRGVSFLYAGRLLKSKNVDQILTHFQELLESDSDNRPFSLTLIGDNDFDSPDAVESSIIINLLHNFPESFYAPGYQTDVTPFMKASDVYISLSKREGLPFAVVEALSLGCKCILSDVPGHKEFSHVDNVTFVRNSDEFREAVKETLVNFLPSEVPDLANFSQVAISKNIIKIIRSLK